MEKILIESGGKRYQVTRPNTACWMAGCGKACSLRDGLLCGYVDKKPPCHKMKKALRRLGCSFMGDEFRFVEVKDEA